MSSTVTEKMKIVGMHCATCAITIERKLRSLNGVVNANVNFAAEEAVVTYDKSKVGLKDIVRAVRDVGYDVYKEEVILSVRGISGVEEEQVIEKKLREIPGVIDVSALHTTQTVRVKSTTSVVVNVRRNLIRP